jgi:hypothetical protein
MSQPTISIGSVWKRRESQDEDFDVVRVVGEVFMGENIPPEWTITPAYSFGEVIQTSAGGILNYCDLVSVGSAEQAEWTTDE